MGPAEREQFAQLGATLPPPAQDEGEEVFNVWDINWPAVRAFLALSTQWRVASLSTRIERLGLDYAAIPSVLKLLGIRKKRLVFAQLRILEAAALSAYGELAE